MNDGGHGLAARERELVELYQELTGANESRARGVFMHVCCRESDDSNVPSADDTGAQMLWEEPARDDREVRWRAAGDWLSGPVPVAAG